MKALVLEAPGRLVYRDVPAPEPTPNEVLVAVRACGICGSDVHGLDGSTGRRIPPLIMGHEAAGVIAATGAEVPAELRRLTDGRGADAAYEAVGVAATVGIAIDSVRRGGAVALVGNVSPTVELPLQTVVTRQLRLQGSCAICGEYPAALDLIARGAIDVTSLISGVAPLADGAAWFERLARREPGLLKVLLTP
jgi:threonine dehydrogenase-like Zn-dependent dehydrogenase